NIAFGNEPRNRTKIRQSRLVRERTGALAALLQRSVNLQTLRLELNGYCLAHVTRAHQADLLDLHFSPTRLRAGRGGQTAQGESRRGSPRYPRRNPAVGFAPRRHFDDYGSRL